MQEIHQINKVKLEISPLLDPQRVTADFVACFPKVSIEPEAGVSVLIYPALHRSVAAALRKKTPVEVALDTWCQTIATALKQRTAQTIFVEDSVLIQTTDATFALGHRLQTTVVARGRSTDDDDDIDDLYMRLAAMTVAALAHTRSVMTDIQARSFHVTPVAIKPHDADAVAHEIAALRTHYRAQRQELRTLVDTAQSNLEKQRTDFQAKVQEIEQKTADILGLQRLKDAQIEKLTKEVKSIRSSTSWRITAPLRRVILALRSGKRKKR